MHVQPEMALERAKNRVSGAGKLGGNLVVERELPTRQAFRAPPG